MKSIKTGGDGMGAIIFCKAMLFLAEAFAVFCGAFVVFLVMFFFGRLIEMILALLVAILYLLECVDDACRNFLKDLC